RRGIERRWRARRSRRISGSGGADAGWRARGGGLAGEDHQAVPGRAAEHGPGQRPIQAAQSRVDAGQPGAEPRAVEDGRGDQVRGAVDPPRAHRDEAGPGEEAVELAAREQPERRVPGVGDPDPAPEGARERLARLGRRGPVAEPVAGERGGEPPRQVERPPALDLQRQVAAGPQHPTELAERPRRILDERERAPAGDGHVEGAVPPRQRLQVAADEPRVPVSPARDGEEPRRQVDPGGPVPERQQERGLEPGAAAGVERKPALAGSARRERTPEEPAEHGVEVLVPGLELVVRCGHRVEGGGRVGSHAASLAGAGRRGRGGRRRNGGARSALARTARGSRDGAGARPRLWPVRRPLALVDGAGPGSVAPLLERMLEGAYQGRRLGEAFTTWRGMIDGEGLIALGLAGSMASAGLWPLVTWLVERGYVDLVVSTSANATEDLLEQRGVRLYRVDADRIDDEV